MRFAGIHHHKVCSVSNELFESNSMQVIKIPPELEHVNAIDLIGCRIKNGEIRSKLAKKPANQMKVALISNYGAKCGIATYSKFLYNELINHVGDYKLFIEYGENLDLDNPHIPQNKIIPCWKRGESILELIKAVKDYDPDIILIQHEFGLWSHAGRWLALMSQLSEYRVIVTMHSVFHHKDKTIVEAAIPEIVVHLQGAVDILKNDKKISGKVYVIPHGCTPYISHEKLWNFYRSKHTFMQFGFGLKYKGFEHSIKTVALLKDKYPDVFFTGLFSENIHNAATHSMYYNELMELIEKLEIQENVAIIRGFQSDETLDSYLRTNQVALFPYISHPNSEVFGASGAARLAMSKGLPVITSSVNHFSDLPTIKANTPEEIAHELDQLFTHKQIRREQINKQIEYLDKNSWSNIASHYINIFENS